jgi:hypothetical protein
VGDAGFSRIGSCLDFAEESLGMNPHRRKFAPYESANP